MIQGFQPPRDLLMPPSMNVTTYRRVSFFLKTLANLPASKFNGSSPFCYPDHTLTAILATPAAGPPSSTGPWRLTYFGAPKIATVFHRTTNDFNPKESS
ncbi:hypothetical protein ADIAG_02020 [Paeniglutamicibacter gangotriensis Lz1y]|uniref:Uncharacterized protein n=1 Tax=Paeniglutamicibacter gangotriensis Lz1y TaxID=1276920 RepID=M7MQC7_9MICC|nr:hypothetical protein ADIAG_02020 [Paeniglutamicibacter gangotriensis Lz1y]